MENRVLHNMKQEYLQAENYNMQQSYDTVMKTGTEFLRAAIIQYNNTNEDGIKIKSINPCQGDVLALANSVTMICGLYKDDDLTQKAIIVIRERAVEFINLYMKLFFKGVTSKEISLDDDITEILYESYIFSCFEFLGQIAWKVPAEEEDINVIKANFVLPSRRSFPGVQKNFCI